MQSCTGALLLLKSHLRLSLGFRIYGVEIFSFASYTLPEGFKRVDTSFKNPVIPWWALQESNLRPAD